MSPYPKPVVVMILETQEGHFKTLGKSRVEIEGIKANQACRNQHDDQVSTKFFVTKEGLDAWSMR